MPELRSLNPYNHRFDHLNLGEVHEVHYAQGVIRNFGVSNQNPLTLDDTCTVEVEGGEYAGVPIVYHCRKDFFDAQVGTLQGNKSLNHAAWGFRAGHKVKVMFHKNQPVAVLGHNEAPVHYPGDPKAPWPCLDVFRLQWHRTIGTERTQFRGGKGTTDAWQNWFGFDAAWYSQHYRASTQEPWKGFCEAPVAPDGTLLDLPHRARHIFGMSELRWGTIVWYAGDWLIVVGPVAFIFMVFSLGMPAPMTGQILVQAAVWTPEREQEWLAVGKRKEEEAGAGGGIWPHLYTEIPYPHMVDQSKFSSLFMNRFSGPQEGQYKPKWIVSEFWTYDWDRLPTDPNTPNTPEG